MLYKALNNEIISLSQNENKDFDPKLGAILIPETTGRIFLHWFSSTGKLQNTFTLHQPTQIYKPVKLINGTDKTISIKVVYIC